MKKVIVLIFAVVILFGCSEETEIKLEKVNSSTNIETSFLIPIESDKGEKETSVFIEGENNEEVKLVKIIESKNVNDLMELILVIQNTNNILESLKFRVLFFDDLGRPLDNLAGWIPIQIEPDDTVYEKVLAKEKSATSYKINLKYLD